MRYEWFKAENPFYSTITTNKYQIALSGNTVASWGDSAAETSSR